MPFDTDHIMTITENGEMVNLFNAPRTRDQINKDKMKNLMLLQDAARGFHDSKEMTFQGNNPQAMVIAAKSGIKTAFGV